MKYEATVLAFAAFAFADSTPAPPPSCAVECFVSNTASTSCNGWSDYHCLCSDEKYIYTAKDCVDNHSTCNQADKDITKQWARDTCHDYDVDINI
ncbi:putative Extracellular membrane protein CFEM domain-containing protein [Seiridium unicorne]|uniref:Extracellular membrane protein CFEM domain-containing protein n=1 Tax=Seiridium unicorne TaxID=138068 RepID=A0ABR2V6Z2_9PEZI